MRLSLTFLCVFLLSIAAVSQKAQVPRSKDAGAPALYACADTVLHEWPDAAPASIGPRFWTDFVDANFIPKLQPLRIIRIIDAGEIASKKVFVVVLRDPAGTEFWDEFRLPERKSQPTTPEAAQALQEEPLGLYSSAHLRVRASMVRSIRMGFVERGMTEFETTCAAGNPEKQNDLGIAGEQWVFDGGKLMVYIQNGRVVDVQRFE